MKMLRVYTWGIFAAVGLLSYVDAFQPPRSSLSSGKLSTLPTIRATLRCPELLKVKSSSTGTEDVLDEELVAERARLRRTSLALWRWASFSWWAQVILSVVSGVTLFFASAIEGRKSSIFGDGIFFSSFGLFLSLVSIAQTWRFSRIAGAIRQRKIDPVALPARLAGVFNACTVVNIAGMALALISAEQVVGLLIGRALSLQGLPNTVGGMAQFGLPLQAIRPLDVFVVQANTNTLASHFVSLVTTLWLKHRLLPKLP